MKKYPLVSKLGLYILDKESAIGVVDVIHAEDLEQLLEKSTVVYGNINQVGSTFEKENNIKFFHYRQDDDTHKALLIAIEPIEQKKVTITRDALEAALKKTGSFYDPEALAKELGLWWKLIL